MLHTLNTLRLMCSIVNVLPLSANNKYQSLNRWTNQMHINLSYDGVIINTPIIYNIDFINCISLSCVSIICFANSLILGLLVLL
jgi:hypothetical protein